MRSWVIWSAGLAPTVLIGGWTAAAAVQPAGYDSLHDTISALAADGATDRWVMTGALAALGACHVATAAGFAELGRTARLVLGIGGVATAAVAAFAQPAAGHAPSATVAFLALTAWPALSHLAPRRAGVVGTAALAVLLGWFFVELRTDGALCGLSERVLAGAQAFGPLVAAGAVLRRGRATAGRP